MTVTLRFEGLEAIHDQGTPSNKFRVRYTIVSGTLGEMPVALSVPAQSDLTAVEVQARKLLLDWADELHDACQPKSAK